MFLVKGATSIIKTIRRNRCVPPKEDASTDQKFVEVNTQISCLLLVALLTESKNYFKRLNRQAVDILLQKNR
jgi:hypothetical protein